MADYKIELGVSLNDKQFGDIKRQLNSLTDNTQRIRIDIDNSRLLKQIEHAKKELKGLNSVNGIKGKQPSLTVNTDSLNEALSKVADAVEKVKDSLGTLDNKLNTKDIVTSVNQIANALGNATDESNSLVVSLKKISEKDFNFNFNFKAGNQNPAQLMTKYGQEVVRTAVPALEKQILYLENAINQKSKNAIQNYFLNKYQSFGGKTFASNLRNESLFGTDSDNKKITGNKQMLSAEKYIRELKEIASLNNIDLSGFNNEFSKTATEVINDTTKIQSGVKDMEEQVEKFKSIFGGIDASGLKEALTPIIDNVDKLGKFIDNLSKNNSIDELTASFNRLADALKPLTNNLQLAKDILNAGFTNANIDTGIKAEDIVPESGEIKNVAQQVGKQIGETIENAVEQSMNLDDVIDKEVLKLMASQGVSGGKDSQAFKDVRKAFLDYRDEQLGKEVESDSMYGSYSTASGIDKLSSTLASHKKVVNNVDDGYKQLLADIRAVNKSGSKVNLVDEIKQEWGDDYSKKRGKLGAAFATGHSNDGTDLADWVRQHNKSWGNLIDLNQDAQGIADQLLHHINVAKELEKKKFISGDDLFETGNLSIDDIAFDATDALAEIEKAEKQAAQSAMDAANVHAQAEEKKRQEYEKTLAEKKQRIQDIDEEINRLSIDKNDPNGITEHDRQGYESAISILRQEQRELLAETKELDAVLDSLGKSDVAQDNIADNFKEIDIQTENAEDQIESLKNALKSLGVSDTSIEKIIQDFKELDATATKVTRHLKDDGSMKLAIKGFNRDGDVVTQTGNIDVDDNYGTLNKSITKELNEAEQKLERLKFVTKEISNLKIDIFKFEDADNIERATNQLNKLEDEAVELRAELQKKFNITSFDEIDDIARKGEEALSRLNDKVTEAKAKLAKGIKADIELGNVDNEMSAMYDRLNKLSDVSKELDKTLEITENAYKELLNAAKASSGDEIADRERLIQAEKEYASALEKTNNLIKIQYRTESRKASNDDIVVFQQKIDTWLTKNSAATKKFGAEMRSLQKQAQSCDKVTLKHLEKEFKRLDSAADQAGLKMQNFGDRISTKFKEYMAYFSVAEVFMYAEQALSSMFEQVKLIDSAMTELKKVTDETDASYNRFLTNAASRAKEIGTTIDGLVSSTADFARLGYDFADAQGLAEVANIYAVVGDDIDSVEAATESLISTLTAFKNEAGDLSDSDFALSIVDKMNEVANNYAISSGGIGDALQRSASSMMAANNSLDETIALITAANTVVQDPDSVGRLMPTLKMAISVKSQRWSRPRKDFISILTHIN